MLKNEIANFRQLIKDNDIVASTQLCPKMCDLHLKSI